MKLERWNIDADGPLNEAAMREKLETKGYTAHKYVYPPST